VATSPPSGGVKPKAQVSAAGGPQKPQATAQAMRPPAFRIRPITKREHHLKLLIYGNYGVGKTHLAGTSSEQSSMRDVLLINAESGDMTLEEFDHIDEVTVTNFNTLARVYEFVKAHCESRVKGDDERLAVLQERFFGEPVGEDHITRLRRYNTVIIDSLSEVNQYCLNQLLGVTASTKLDEDPMAAEFKEYKQNHTMMLRFVRAFRDLPMHVIFTAAEAYVQDEMKRQHFTPEMTGKLSKQIQGFMDMVGYYVMGTPTELEGKPGEKVVPRRLFVMPNMHGKHDAKHRYVRFKGSHFDNPSIPKILREIGFTDGEGVQVK